MAIHERKLRERAERERLITSTARSLAELEGWDAVTTRRLSNEIEYSQPVIYKHFASMEDLIEAIALDGFTELAQALRIARTADGPSEEAMHRVALAFTAFAAQNPALYDAMFTRSTRLRFAASDTPAPLAHAFVELRQAVEPVADGRDLETLTEVLWSALHGLCSLDRNARLRPGQGVERVELLVDQFRGETSHAR